MAATEKVIVAIFLVLGTILDDLSFKYSSHHAGPE